MKVILNADIKHLGEEGDVKLVAAGYARNYLFPRNLALPYNDTTVAYFESKKEEIEARKAQKRADSASLKEKLDALTLVIKMPAGANGKLYGAVTNLSVAEALAKEGYDIERKRIEVPGSTVKMVGKFVAHVRLYEAAVADVTVSVEAQEEQKKEAPKADKKESRAEKKAETPAPAEAAAPVEPEATAEAASSDAAPAAEEPKAE
ncbi:MAG: 50S ribosomal protein L9 [Spirochaetaceae bacterium]|nr:50S ribosomal protein L9 [Spirochaetaceae bacterium]